MHNMKNLFEESLWHIIALVDSIKCLHSRWLVHSPIHLCYWPVTATPGRWLAAPRSLLPWSRSSLRFSPLGWRHWTRVRSLLHTRISLRSQQHRGSLSAVLLNRNIFELLLPNETSLKDSPKQLTYSKYWDVVSNVCVCVCKDPSTLPRRGRSFQRKMLHAPRRPGSSMSSFSSI